MGKKKTLQYWQEYELQRVSSQELFLRKKLGGHAVATDVTSYEWLFIQIDLQDGMAQLKLEDASLLVESGAYGLFVPPFSIYQSQFDAFRAEMRAYFSLLPIPRALPNSPVFFRWQSPPFEGYFAEMIAALNAADDFLYARMDEPNEDHNDLARQIKISIDRTFEQDCLLTRLANELRITPAYLSRVFKKRYGLTAVDYRSKLRSVWAVQQLIRSERRNICDVAFDVGYNDLSRFNKQFRRHVRMAPGMLKKLSND